MMSDMSEMQQSPAREAAPVMRVVPGWTLGWRMQRALDFAGIKAGDMAIELGVSRGTVSRWMHDEGAKPKRAYLTIWADRCGVPSDWLDEEEQVKGPETSPGSSAVGAVMAHAA